MAVVTGTAFEFLRRREGERAIDDLLDIDLDAGDEAMAEPPGGDVGGDLGRVGPRLGAGIARLRVGLHRPLRRIGVGQVRPLGDGGDVGAQRTAVARLGRQRDRRRHPPFAAQGADVGGRMSEIARDDAVEGAPVDGERPLRADVERDAPVGQAVGGQVVIVGDQVDARRRRPLERAGDAPAVVVRRAPPGDVRVGPHAVDPQRQCVAQLSVDVAGDAPRRVGAAGDLAADEVRRHRRLADEVDRAAGRTAPAEGRRRPLDDLDLLEREHLAAGDAGIAQAVDVDVAARVEAADEDAVAERIAALAGAERDPRLGPREVAEAERAEVGDDRMRDDRHRLRRVEDRLGQLRRRRAVDLVRRAGVGERVAGGADAGDDDLADGIGGGIGGCGMRRRGEQPARRGKQDRRGARDRARPQRHRHPDVRHRFSRLHPSICYCIAFALARLLRSVRSAVAGRVGALRLPRSTRCPTAPVFGIRSA